VASEGKTNIISLWNRCGKNRVMIGPKTIGIGRVTLHDIGRLAFGKTFRSLFFFFLLDFIYLFYVYECR
jgi:hypothetical protein